jgi:hypothetical protein
MAIPGYEKKSKGKKLAERGYEEEEGEEMESEGGGAREGFIAEVMRRGCRSDGLMRQ